MPEENSREESLYRNRLDPLVNPPRNLSLSARRGITQFIRSLGGNNDGELTAQCTADDRHGALMRGTAVCAYGIITAATISVTVHVYAETSLNVVIVGCSCFVAGTLVLATRHMIAVWDYLAGVKMLRHGSFPVDVTIGPSRTARIYLALHVLFIGAVGTNFGFASGLYFNQSAIQRRLSMDDLQRNGPLAEIAVKHANTRQKLAEDRYANAVAAERAETKENRRLANLIGRRALADVTEQLKKSDERLAAARTAIEARKRELEALDPDQEANTAMTRSPLYIVKDHALMTRFGALVEEINAAPWKYGIMILSDFMVLLVDSLLFMVIKGAAAVPSLRLMRSARIKLTNIVEQAQLAREQMGYAAPASHDLPQAFQPRSPDMFLESDLASTDEVATPFPELVPDVDETNPFAVFEQAEPIRRGAGRPKGSKNKPKTDLGLNGTSRENSHG